MKWTKQHPPRLLCGDCRSAIDREIKKRRGVFEYHRKKIAPVVFERDGHKCRHCGTSERLTVDHKISMIDGGTDDLQNLQTLCQTCNSRKANLHQSHG